MGYGRYRNLSQDEVETLSIFFQSLDKQQKGYLTIDEIKRECAVDLNKDGWITEEEANRCANPWMALIAQQDKNGDGRISLDELLQFNDEFKSTQRPTARPSGPHPTPSAPPMPQNPYAQAPPQYNAPYGAPPAAYPPQQFYAPPPHQQYYPPPGQAPYGAPPPGAHHYPQQPAPTGNPGAPGPRPLILPGPGGSTQPPHAYGPPPPGYPGYR